jgi:hypothetical protein
MKTNEASEHEVCQPPDQLRKKPYETPRITPLNADQAKAKLAARVLTGDREAEAMLRLVS